MMYIIFENLLTRFGLQDWLREQVIHEKSNY